MGSKCGIDGPRNVGKPPPVKALPPTQAAEADTYPVGTVDHNSRRGRAPVFQGRRPGPRPGNEGRTGHT